jgi:nucleotide-binding universal stress UspA family protein
MFKHVLIPTDGSSLSRIAVERGLDMAKAMDARVTVLHVQTPFHVFAADTAAVTDTRPEYERHAKAKAKEIAGAVEALAAKKGVNCGVALVTAEHPYEEIISKAAEQGCDLIVMASHGRKGVKGLLLGSETQKVLTHSSVPVLVYR